MILAVRLFPCFSVQCYISLCGLQFLHHYHHLNHEFINSPFLLLLSLFKLVSCLEHCNDSLPYIFLCYPLDSLVSRLWKFIGKIPLGPTMWGSEGNWTKGEVELGWDAHSTKDLANPIERLEYLLVFYGCLKLASCINYPLGVGSP